jgi:hypothetical protein
MSSVLHLTGGAIFMAVGVFTLPIALVLLGYLVPSIRRLLPQRCRFRS